MSSFDISVKISSMDDFTDEEKLQLKKFVVMLTNEQVAMLEEQGKITPDFFKQVLKIQASIQKGLESGEEKDKDKVARQMQKMIRDL
ncbi:MAG: hypothetical protein ABII13_04545 [Patescibacteria group bacterium]|nr:hypothetical protein [Patescibacteria group bacterium]MBU2509313.1 hypothetical protein [Patescibacteria group bacterium]